MCCAAKALVIAIAAIGLVAACAEERSVTLSPTKSRMYVTAVDIPTILFVFDADADSLIDSLVLPLEWGLPVVFSDHDEARFAISNFFHTRIYRASSAAPYYDDSLPTVGLAFDAPRGLLIGTRGGHGTVAPPILRLYDPNTLSVLFGDTIGLGHLPRLDRQRGLAYGITTYQDDPGGPDFRVELCAYDYVNRQLHQCWNILPDSTGRGYILGAFALHPDGHRAYLTAGHTHLLGYDLKDERIFFDVPIYSTQGEPMVSPDGSEVWYPEEGLALPSDPGTITIYDAVTGAQKDVIDLNAYRIRPGRPIRPSHMRFTLDGDKVYVLCYGEQGPVLVIDVKTHTVIKSFYFHTGEVPERRLYQMDVGPAP